MRRPWFDGANGEVRAALERAKIALAAEAERIEQVAAIERVWAAATVWATHSAEIGLPLAEGRALATRTGYGSGVLSYGTSLRSTVCGEAPMAEGRHYAEFAVVKMTIEICGGLVPAAIAGEAAWLRKGWKSGPAVHMFSTGGYHNQGGSSSGWEGKARYETSDVVGLLLDLDRGTLTAYNNGERLGVTVPNAEVKELGAGPFCWAVDLYGKGAEGAAVRIARGAPPPA